jgi:transcription elongation factor Elf1
MTCWHCNEQLVVDFQTNDFSMKFYHCAHCDKWYEMRKEKVKVNGAMPVKFFELNSSPQANPAIAALL